MEVKWIEENKVNQYEWWNFPYDPQLWPGGVMLRQFSKTVWSIVETWDSIPKFDDLEPEKYSLPQIVASVAHECRYNEDTFNDKKNELREDLLDMEFDEDLVEKILNVVPKRIQEKAS